MNMKRIILSLVGLLSIPAVCVGTSSQANELDLSQNYSAPSKAHRFDGGADTQFRSGFIRKQQPNIDLFSSTISSSALGEVREWMQTTAACMERFSGDYFEKGKFDSKYVNPREIGTTLFIAMKSHLFHWLDLGAEANWKVLDGYLLGVSAPTLESEVIAPCLISGQMHSFFNNVSDSEKSILKQALIEYDIITHFPATERGYMLHNG